MSFPSLDPLDTRLNAWRPELADARLRGKVVADRFVSGSPGQISVAFTDIRSRPDRLASIDTQLLYGDQVTIFDESDGWLWVQNTDDGYVGWIEAAVIDNAISKATHFVSVPRTFFYPEPDIKKPHRGIRSLGSRFEVVDTAETRGTPFLITARGDAVFAGHARPCTDRFDDYVSVAESLLATPYLWGGTTAYGVDCSGFVQLAMKMAGRSVLRDSDMQAATIGEAIDDLTSVTQLKRGDLVFWHGHVGICQGHGRMIHANAHTMNVASEPIEEAIARIAYLYQEPIGFRRPPGG